MSIIEWVAVLATMLSVLILAKGNVFGWIFGIIGCSLYGFIFIEQKLYVNVIVQVIFIAQGIYGVLEWNKKIPGQSFESKKLDSSAMLAVVTLTSVLSIMISSMMYSFIESTNPILDTTLSIFSIAAMTMMIKKIIQSWFFWMVVDVGYIYLFISLDLWVSAGLYVLLLLICINGYIQWKKELGTNIK